MCAGVGEQASARQQVTAQIDATWPSLTRSGCNDTSERACGVDAITPNISANHLFLAKASAGRPEQSTRNPTLAAHIRSA
jgi:hypothetical protein